MPVAQEGGGVLLVQREQVFLPQVQAQVQVCVQTRWLLGGQNRQRSAPVVVDEQLRSGVAGCVQGQAKVAFEPGLGLAPKLHAAQAGVQRSAHLRPIGHDAVQPISRWREGAKQGERVGTLANRHPPGQGVVKPQPGQGGAAHRRPIGKAGAGFHGAGPRAGRVRVHQGMARQHVGQHGGVGCHMAQRHGRGQAAGEGAAGAMVV